MTEVNACETEQATTKKTALQQKLHAANRDELLEIAYQCIRLCDSSWSIKDLVWHAVNTEYNWKLVATGEPRVLLTDEELRGQLLEDFLLNEDFEDVNWFGLLDVVIGQAARRERKALKKTGMAS